VASLTELAELRQTPSVEKIIFQNETPQVQGKLPVPAVPEPEDCKKTEQGGNGHRTGRKRGGRHLREAEGSAKLAKERKLRERAQKNGIAHRATGFSVVQDGRHSTTGWQGGLPPKQEREWVLKAYESGEIKKVLAQFHLVHHHL
jgi:hypothetical protein